ncbi:hypothetical protein AX16_007044 [Volvariella volvacea WC 439]|nr:hypothetical protein AX16_007044 [Volvariella volvacea WC 439]
MKTSILFSLLAFTLPLSVFAQEGVTDTIISNAAADGVPLDAIDPSVLNSALNEIAQTYEEAETVAAAAEKRSNSRIFGRTNPSMIDVHTHVVPSWYRDLVPTTGGNPTPVWDLAGHLSFMQTQGISRSIIAFSAPGANVYQGNKLLTVALARLINEQAAAYCRAFPNKFNFYAVVPLPYTQEAITEAQYALDRLGAVGIILQSNFGGMYLGNAQFQPFFQWLNRRSNKEILYVHPATPYVKFGNNLIEANPTPYPTGNIEFYFETARTLMDLTLTQTIHNYPNIHYVIPHVGGAFPTVLDRFLKTVPNLYDSTMSILQNRFWWDSAGPTYFHQVAGLLGYDIPKSRLLYGTDFPYAPSFTQAGSLAAVQNSPLLTSAEKSALFSSNPQNLFAGKINF